ncbi:MAG: PhzF family phenazine biosynthesis protein [Pseudomonadota bacterium]
MRFYQIDAFAERALAGNPAAVMPLSEFLPAETLQAIAAENNLAETAFIVPKGENVWDLRWFTPKVEVKLCGHATLASAHALLAEEGVDADEVGFDTASGRLTVKRLSGDRLEMDFPSYASTQVDKIEGLAEALGKSPKGVWTSAFMLAEFDTPDDVLALTPDLKALANVGAETEWGGKGNVICIAPGGEPGVDVTSRFFGPGAGVPEDPATGSAHCQIAPLFSDKLGKPILSCVQAYPGRGALIETEIAGDRVKLRGRARTVIDGVFRL